MLNLVWPTSVDISLYILLSSYSWFFSFRCFNSNIMPNFW